MPRSGHSKQKKTTKTGIKSKPKKTKNRSKDGNLRPSVLNKKKASSKKSKPKPKPTPNPIYTISLSSDFGIDYIKLIDGYIRESNLNITIFIEISKLIYSYTLINMLTGCWSYYLEYAQSYFMTYYHHYYTLQIHSDYSFQLNCADYMVEDEIFSDTLCTLPFKGYIERNRKNKYILLLEHKSGVQFLNNLKKGKHGLFVNKKLVINDTQREKIYLQRVLNVYKSQNMNDEELLKTHKRYKTDKGALNWECVSKKLFNDLKYGKLDVKGKKKKNKAIRDVPDMHVLYKRLCGYYSIKPLGVYIGDLYIKFGDKCKSAKIKYNKIDFFGTLKDITDKSEHMVELKTANIDDLLQVWKRFYHGNGVKRHAEKLNAMGYSF